MFFKLIFKNLFRNKSRSILTMLGVTIGILLIVSLGMLSAGLEDETNQLMGGADSYNLTIQGPGISGTNGEYIYSQLPSQLVSNISDYSEVSKVTTAKEIDYLNINNNDNLSTYALGLDSSNLGEVGFDSARMVEGNIFDNDKNEVIIANDIADKGDIKVGDTINISNQNVTVSGIFRSSIISSYNCFMPEHVLNNITGFNESNSLFVSLNDGVDTKDFTNTIRSDFKDNNLQVYDKQNLQDQVNQVFDEINIAVIAISAISIFVGAIGVINTMLMSLSERTKEIGVLKAVGWKDNKILLMVLIESILISLFATIIGIILGYILMNLVVSMGLINLNNLYLSLNTIIEAFIIAIIVGVVGAIVPVKKALNLEPTEALRYE